ncbi:suppressor of glycerol defect protein 1 [Quercus suber]|uniref:Suppressor of glycerol defect protein 1 n=1 Tax=Quercus suber TaxID=58331 RepID=A0AAW0L8F5_QUESU
MSKNVNKSSGKIKKNVKKIEFLAPNGNSESESGSQSLEKEKSNSNILPKEVEVEEEDKPLRKRKKGSKGILKKKTKFEEYLEIGMHNSAHLLAEEDLEMERKLAKKLKVKDGGKLRGEDDEVPDEDEASSRKKHKKRKLLVQEQEGDMGVDTAVATSKPVQSCAAKEVPANAPAGKGTGKYIAPHLRARAGNESEEHIQIRRRVRGLLNRLSESNVESITSEISNILHSITRGAASQIFSEEVLASCSGELGKATRGDGSSGMAVVVVWAVGVVAEAQRNGEGYAAVFGAFVAGMACLFGNEFSAKLMDSLAKCFEDEYHKEDNLSLRNITLLLSYFYIFGVCSSDLIYDFLLTLSKRLTEIDVSVILTTLQCCGMKIRADDPAAMKNFILNVQNRSIFAATRGASPRRCSCGMKIRADDPAAMKNFILNVQNRVNELKVSSGDGQENIISKRMEFMLETICDIKNNKKRVKEDPAHHTRIKKWLQKLRVEGIVIRGLKWSKLLDPEKKGQWWLSGDMASTMDNVAEIASTIDKEVLEAQKMLQLAAAQRMNTERVDIEKPRHRTVVTSDVQQQIMTMNRKAREEWEKKQAEVEKLRRLNDPEGNNGVNGDKEKDDGRGKSLKKREGGVDTSGSQPSKDVSRKPLSTSGRKDNQEIEKRANAALVAASVGAYAGNRRHII